MSPIIIKRVEELGRRQGVKSLKFRYRKNEDWLPIDIDKLLLPDELVDEEAEMDQPYDEGYNSDEDSDYNPEEESDSDDEDDVPELLGRNGSYYSDSSDDESDSEEEDFNEDVDEEELAEVLDSDDVPRGVGCQVEKGTRSDPNQDQEPTTIHNSGLGERDSGLGV